MEIQNRKKFKVEDDNVSLHHRFWSEAPEDLLIEIFIRHPDCESAARTTAVCRRWRSAISRNPQFIRRFNSHHKIFLWAMIFGLVDIDDHLNLIPKPQYFRSLCHLQSDESMLLGGKLPDDWLGFLPSPMMIRASCKDLLLVSPGLCFNDDLYICNPMTRQFFKLPAIPRRPEDTKIYASLGRGYALVTMPSSSADTKSKFKVVEVINQSPPRKPDHRVEVSVYTSESRKWEIMHFPGPRPKTYWLSYFFSSIIRCNEVLFWAGSSWDFQRVVYLDLKKKKLGAINIPLYRCGDSFFQYQIGNLHASGGVDELRLVHVISPHTTDIVHLRVWSLNNNRDEEEDDEKKNWFLVHDKKLKRPNYLSKAEPLVGTFVHPTNGDLLFLVWGKIVIEYNLIDKTYKKMTELLERAYWSSFKPFLMDLSLCSPNFANTYF